MAFASSNRSSLDPPTGGTVTSLAAKHGGDERLVVYVDGKRAFEVAALLIEAEGLRAGAVLTAEAVDALLAKDEPYRARDKALRLIALRDRSRHEVESRLERAGFGAAAVGSTLAWLVSLGFVDDARFASRYAAEKRRGGWGERRIVSDLSRLGVDRRLVRQVLEESAAIDEARTEPDRGSQRSSNGEADQAVESALQLARRRFGRQFAADPESAARRLAGFLARRGFDWDTIGRITRTLREEAGLGDRSDGDADGG